MDNNSSSNIEATTPDSAAVPIVLLAQCALRINYTAEETLLACVTPWMYTLIEAIAASDALGGVLSRQLVQSYCDPGEDVPPDVLAAVTSSALDVIDALRRISSQLRDYVSPYSLTGETVPMMGTE